MVENDHMRPVALKLIVNGTKPGANAVEEDVGAGFPVPVFIFDGSGGDLVPEGHEDEDKLGDELDRGGGEGRCGRTGNSVRRLDVGGDPLGDDGDR